MGNRDPLNGITYEAQRKANKARHAFNNGNRMQASYLLLNLLEYLNSRVVTHAKVKGESKKSSKGRNYELRFPDHP